MVALRRSWPVYASRATERLQYWAISGALAEKSFEHAVATAVRENFDATSLAALGGRQSKIHQMR